MSVRSFKVILDNNVKEQTFNVKCKLFNYDSFLRILKLSNFLDKEISNECFVDDIYYHELSDVNFDEEPKVFKLYSLGCIRNFERHNVSEVSDEVNLHSLLDGTESTNATQTPNIGMTMDEYEVDENEYEVDENEYEVDENEYEVDENEYEVDENEYEVDENEYEVDENEVEKYGYDGKPYWYKNGKLHIEQQPVDIKEQNELGFNVVLGLGDYDSDVCNAGPEVPRRLKNKKTPNAPRKRNRRELSDSEDDFYSENNSENGLWIRSREVTEVTTVSGSDDSLVESVYCIKCFGFDASAENPIVRCKNRRCFKSCHKNCTELPVFTCNVHKKDRVCRKLF